MYVNNIILVTRPREKVKLVDQGILTYDGLIENIPLEYYGDWVNEIYSDFNAIVIELRK